MYTLHNLFHTLCTLASRTVYGILFHNKTIYFVRVMCKARFLINMKQAE